MHAGSNTTIMPRICLIDRKCFIRNLMLAAMLQTSVLPKMTTSEGSHRIFDDNDSIFPLSKSIHMKQSKNHFVCFIRVQIK